MSYPFPPPIPPQISLWAIAGNLFGMLLALAATLGAFRWGDRPKRLILWGNWGIAVLLVAAVGGLGLASENTRLHIQTYFIFVWLVIGPTCLLSLVSKDRPTLGAVLGWLAVIGVLVFVFVVPASGHPRQAFWRSQCKSNLKQLGLAYDQAHEKGFGAPLVLSDGDPPHSWRTHAFITDNSPGREFDLKRPWDDPVNLTLARTSVASFRCPANFHPTDDAGRHFSAYAAVTGPQSAFPNGTALPLKQFTDGTSNTIVYGEAAGLRIVWTEPRDIDIAREPIGINLPGTKPAESPGTLSSYHAGGATVVFGDGSVRYLSERINPAVLKALLTATGGESISDAEY